MRQTNGALSRTRIALVIGVWAICVTSIASAGRRILVLKADGNASIEIKVRVDAQVLRLAKSTDATVEPGEVTFADAATAVGCSGTEAKCRAEVLSTMGVDEVVSLTVTGVPNGDIRVAVHRIGRTGAIREANALIPAGQSIDAKIGAGIGPLFGVKPKPVPDASPSPLPELEHSPGPVTEEPPRSAFGEPDPVNAGANPPAEQPPPPLQQPSEPIAPIAEGGRTNGRAIAGMAVGGGLMTVAVILWTQASGVQSDIHGAATNSPADFKRLQDLESRGDAYANFGNAFFIAGAVVAGVSSYFFFRDRFTSTRHARVIPTLFEHGGGIAVSFGGAP
jgi:hypothetical protein